MYWDIIHVHPIGHRTLAVKFADGLEGRVIIDRSFCTGVFQPLADDELLNKVMVEHGALTWPNGLDLAPDTMYAEIKHSPQKHYVVGQHIATHS